MRATDTFTVFYLVLNGMIQTSQTHLSKNVFPFQVKRVYILDRTASV